MLPPRVSVVASSLTSAIVAGRVKATPIPWSARIPSSATYPSAKTYAPLATVRIPSPKRMKIRRAPRRSDNRPVNGWRKLLKKPYIERISPVTSASLTPNAPPVISVLATYSGRTTIRNELPIASAIRASASVRTSRSTLGVLTDSPSDLCSRPSPGSSRCCPAVFRAVADPRPLATPLDIVSRDPC